MNQSNSNSFDLIVYGHIARDLLVTSNHYLERIGGVAYAASTAAKLGARVGILASLNSEKQEPFISELTERGVDCSGVVHRASEPVTYYITEANEIVPQSTVRFGPTVKGMPLPSTVPDQYKTSRAALIYPVDVVKSVEVCQTLKEQGTLVAIDIQHDLHALDEATALLKLADFVFVSQAALLALCCKETIAEAVSVLRDSTSAVIVVKMGMRGSLVFELDATHQIPSFISDFQVTVGAGDAYDAAFLVSLLNDEAIEEAGRKAAYAASCVIESIESNPANVLSDNWDSGERQGVFIAQEFAAATRIYIAGHFHSLPLRLFIERIAAAIEHLGFRTFVPHRDVGVVGVSGLAPVAAYQQDMAGLRDVRALVAVLDNASRGGTFVEIGVAAERNLPIFGICTDETLGISNMVKNSCRSLQPTFEETLKSLVVYFSE